MKKRILALLMAMVMVISLLPLTAQAGELDNGLVYQVYEDHVKITGYTGDAAEVAIPSEIEGLPVTCIDDFAFLDCKNLSSIDLPDGVTFIGTSAFYGCSSLTSIVIPDSVTSIEESAFASCSALTSIVIPDSITSIAYSTFFDCSSLTSIVIPDSITSIGEYAFYYCSSLSSIDIPGTVTSIGLCAFSCCSSLTQIYVDENNLNYSTDEQGVLFDKDKTLLICAPGAIADTYTIPDSVISINEYAFYGCNRLTTIDIPDSVTSIGDCTFSLCSALTSIDLPDGITSISDSVFPGCSSLISIDIPGSVSSIGDWAFSNCISLISIHFEGNAPLFEENVFSNVTATAYYPANDPTWTEAVMQDYGGNITWVPYNPNNPFTDVPTGAFYEAPVLWALKNSITTGASENSFNPDGSCLRAQVVTFLHRAAGNPAPGNANNPFTDVKTSDFFYAPVLWAVEKGITNGTGAATFGSYDVCNRAAVVTFLWRAAGSPEPESTDNPFTDVRSSDFFYKPVLWAIENGITNGVDATHFGPTSPCNRAQVVTFLYRTYN